MLYNLNCPKCGAEQKGLNLEETGGSYICSKCGEHIEVDLDELKRDSVNNKMALNSSQA